MTEKSGFDPISGTWNDSLIGDFLWSRNNFGEGRPDVMSPFTYSISEKVWSKVSPLPGYHLSGNICGRSYANVSFGLSIVMAMGRSRETAIEEMSSLLGNVPEGLEIPTIPLSRSKLLLAFPRIIRLGLREKRGRKDAPEFMTTNPGRCQAVRQRIQRTKDKDRLIEIWHEVITTDLEKYIWVLGGATIHIPAHKETYTRYRELPAYPMIIRGTFDPFLWAAGSNRRNDVYDATAAAPLSHAAIVARELGIPAVVGCGSATTRLRSGDRVRVDGGQGLVEILDYRDSKGG